MRKTTFFIAIFFASLSSLCQDYLISFTGSGLGSTVDTVLVVNLSNGDSLLMSGADTLHLTSSAGVQHFKGAGNELNIYPNPMNHSSTIDFFKVSPGITTIGIFDVAGRCIRKIVKHLPSGRHIFEISGLKAGIYFVQVNCGDNTFTGRLASAAGQALAPVLRYRGTIESNLSVEKLKSATGIVQMLYFEGERILMKGCSNKHSRVITFVPEQNETIDFEFVECVDADDKHYPVVTIGEQTWMAENLNYEAENSVCYDFDPEYCKKFGRLYDWATANIVCPEGWYLPGDLDWKILEGYVDSVFNIGDPEWDNFGWRGFDVGKRLKSTAMWDNDGSGSNMFGFSALPSGGCDPWHTCGMIGYTSLWWTSDERNDNDAFQRYLIDQSDLSNRSWFHKEWRKSVRCLLYTIPTPTTYNLNLEANPTGAGTVTGEGQYEAGEQINLNAEANPGWEFENWTDDDGIVSEEAGFTYTMPAMDVTLTANFAEEQVGFTCGVSTIMDIDGNVYNTVFIGDQCWMKENLKTTHYRTGTPIVYPGADNNAWQNNTTGAYAWYNNDSSWKDSYGALYNWHAVNNANGLCPTGWYVPSDDEWTQLVDYIIIQGYPNQSNDPNGAGNALKSCRQVNSPLGGDCNTTEHPRWHSHDTHHGFDEFGFAALPGGGRSGGSGSYFHLETHGYWWSSTETSSGWVWEWRMNSYEGGVSSGHNHGKSAGFSVRCIRDETTPPTTYNLILEVNPTGAGIVTGEGQFEAGEQINLNAEANPGWEFVNWTDDDGIVSEEAGFTYTMPAQDVTLTANFVEEQASFTCGDPLIDPRDGQSYATVRIGNQCWMAENLNIGTRIDGSSNQYNNGIIEKYCHNNSEAMCDVYGGLYQWDEMMQYTTTQGVKGICPEGWHIPTDDEWTTLTTYVSSQPEYLCNNNPNWNAKAMAAKTNWNNSSNTCAVGNNISANNATMFTAMGGGYRYSPPPGSFYPIGRYGYWWSSTEFTYFGTKVIWIRYIYYEYANVYPNFYDKYYGFSVRCLRD